MSLFKKEDKIKKDINLTTLSRPQDDDGPINALPEYKIRTMYTDLQEIEPQKEIKKAPLPKTDTKEIKKEKKIEKQQIREERKKIKERKKQERIEKQQAQKTALFEKKKSLIKRAPLPNIEELIKSAPIDKKIKKAPLPGTEQLIGSIPINLPIIEESKKDIKEAKPEKKIESYIPIPRKRKIRPIFLLLIIALLIIGGVFYWINREPEPVIPDPIPEQIQPSESLIQVNETKIFDLQDSLFELIKEKSQNQEIGITRRLAILKNEKEFLSLNELFQKLEITPPPYTISNLEENYTLVIYSQEQGKRLNLVIQVKNSEILKQRMKEWESTMFNNFSKFYIDDQPGEKASEAFLIDNYKGIDIRYINLPDPDLTLNYTIRNNLLIIGTSKQAIYSIVDNL